MKRSENIDKITLDETWDLLVIGGGATGLGIALDGTTRGYKTLLLEANDFAKGTSSRSTKLVHGGVRYLAQGDVSLVREALRERGRLAKNAPHLFRTQAFVIPGEKWWSAPYYTFGLWLYDRLAGKLSIGKTKYLSKQKARSSLSGVKLEKLNNGVCYYDGQFDDSRLALSLAQSICDHGGHVVNYFSVVNLMKNSDGKVCGVIAVDQISGKEYSIRAKCVVNATGVFTNELIAMDQTDAKPTIVPSQGVHIVLERKFLPGDHALMVPKTSDGRVLFAVPWHDKLIVGTTDTLVPKVEYEPRPLEAEIAFLLATTKAYFTQAPNRADVKSVYVGLRPLAAPKEEGKSTKEVSRSHRVEISESGFVHIFGGKWTTYRQMAEDTIDAAIKANLLDKADCQTMELPLHGHQEKSEHFSDSPMSLYGSDAAEIEMLIRKDSPLGEKIHADYPYTMAQVAWAVDKEMAISIEDVLARRIRLLFLDAKAAGQSATKVAALMADKLSWSQEEKQEQIIKFQSFAEQYQLSF